jgi:hypothetical protein
MPLPIPNGKTYFPLNTGAPNAGGLAFHYIPGTSTPSPTYQDINATITNSNPVVMDSAGLASIYGTGSYRQVVTDSLGNQLWDQVTQVANLATIGAVAKAGDTMTGTLTVPNVVMNGNVGTTQTPIGNPSLLAVQQVTGTAQSATQSEILFSINYTASVGQGASVPASKNKVALYAAMQANSGSGNVWAFNPLLLLNAGANSIGGAQVAEFDLANNSGTNFGEAVGGGGIIQPAAFGIQVTGISANRATAAIAVLGNLTDLTSPMWNRGIFFANNSVKQVAFADYTTSGTSVDIRGNHTYGADFANGVFGSGSVRLGNTQGIIARNAANSADYNLINTTGADSVQIGSASNANVVTLGSATFIPGTDNAVTLGSNAFRWSVVWAANGTIQTSDPALKTDIAHLPDTGPILDAINPITFRWVDGGGGTETVTVRKTVQKTVKASRVEHVTTVVNGVATQVENAVEYDDPVFNYLPVSDADGKEVYSSVTGEPRRIMHAVPVMIEIETEETVPVPSPGKRTHWGFDASQLASVAGIAGRDFGGFVQDDDGGLHIRPDQLIPILWAEVKALRARVAKIEATAPKIIFDGEAK